MSDWIREAILDRLHGKHIHLEPLAVVDGISETDALKTPYSGGRSSLELLFHIVFWLEFSLGLLDGKVMEYRKDVDWETNGVSWGNLKERFIKGLTRLEFIAENWELDTDLDISDELKTCVGAEVLGVIQHTSYHLGQIVFTRRALGLWTRK